MFFPLIPEMKSSNFHRFYIELVKLKDPMKIYDVEYWIYVLTGCWEYRSEIQWKTNLYKAYQSVVVLIYGLSLTFFVMDAILVSDDLEKLSFNMSSSFLLFVTMGKVCLFYREKDSLENVYSKLENHLHVKTIGGSLEDRSILKKKAEVLRSITSAFYALLALGFPLRIIADTTLTRAYLIPIPYRERVEPHYEKIYTVQAFIIFHFLVTVLSHDLLVYAVLVRFIAHYEILEKNFLKIKTLYPNKNCGQHVRDLAETGKPSSAVDDVLILKSNNSEKYQKFLENYTLTKYKMVNWVKNNEIREKRVFEVLRENIIHHQILLRETKNFARLYSSPLLVQACGAGILIGIVILQILFLSKQINALLVEQVIYVGTLLWDILHLCTFATELKTKSRAVAEALYDIPWYEMGVKNRRIIHIAIRTMMEGPKLKGGNMIVVNRVTYLKFLRISYNLIAVLRQVY